MSKRKIINDPVYGFLTIDDDVIYDIIEHPYFQRLRNIKQLGFTYYVYPGATHNRFSHALGCLNLMGRALEVLKMKGVQITTDEALGAKLAILLHDIGHGPFSHTMEHMLVDVDHEVLTRLFMERLNQKLDGKLTTAINIFDGTYPKQFLHQLVSSQLDMDRLDYLSRDSFFSGVSEGVVGTERIINMLNVHNDELVVDQKGIYSIEKFIISRRLMYWQVYLHKTVVAADMLLVNAVQRARELCQQASTMFEGHNANMEYKGLMQFIAHTYSEDDFRKDDSLLDRFAAQDDSDVMHVLKTWSHASDDVLSRLASNLMYRRLPAISISDKPVRITCIDELRGKAVELCQVSLEDSRYFVGTGTHENHAYDFNDQEIRVLFKDGTCKDISEASDQLDRHFLEKAVKKYYIYYPKELKQ